MKVFISIPMSGRSDEEVFTEMKSVKKVFTDYISEVDYIDQSIEFVDTYVQSPAPDDCVTPPLWYLGESIKVLSKCDAIILAPGWFHAKGCKVERRVAESYGLKLFDMQYRGSTWRITNHDPNRLIDPTWVKTY